MLATMTGNDRSQEQPPGEPPAGEPLPGDQPPADSSPGDLPSADQATPADLDATAEAPAADLDATAEAPTPPADRGPSGTAVLPPVAEQEQAPVRPRWEGRAAVPAPPPVEEYPEPEYEPPRSIALPVLITIVVMLLVGVLAVGVWLILTNRRGDPTPLDSASLTPPPTTTSAPTTTAPPTTTPAGVVIPSVLGEDYDGAAAILEALGLVPAMLQEFNEAEPGTVLGTDPPEGTRVAKDTIVTIIVSKGPQAPPTTEAPTPTPTSSGTTED